MSSWDKLVILKEKNSAEKNSPTRLAHGLVSGVLLDWWFTWEAWLPMGGVTPGLVVLSKQEEHSMRNKPQATPLLTFLSDGQLSGGVSETNPCFSKLLLVLVFYYSNRNCTLHSHSLRWAKKGELMPSSFFSASTPTFSSSWGATELLLLLCTCPLGAGRMLFQPLYAWL